MNELTTLHDAITATIKAAMPQVETVEAFPEGLDGLTKPAIAFALTGMDPGADPGDGRSGVKVTFEARVLVDANLPHAPLAAVNLAAQLVDLLRLQAWGLDFVEGTTAARAMPTNVSTLSLHYLSWTVQWQQIIYFGQEEWPWPNQGPGSLVFGFAPDTGPGNEDAYQSPEQMQ
nr:hypothetical protein FFPRI1PSEUD_14670 [Pseudomonas sp. FFPRI_1]